MNHPTRIRVLFAAAPLSLDPITRILGPDFQVTIADSLSHAKSLLDRPVDVIVCDLYFDESRMFDLLRHVKADEKTRTIPFIAVKASDGMLSPTLSQGVEIACNALGAEKFVELGAWENRYGPAEAHQRFRALIARALET